MKVSLHIRNQSKICFFYNTHHDLFQENKLHLIFRPTGNFKVIPVTGIWANVISRPFDTSSLISPSVRVSAQINMFKLMGCQLHLHCLLGAQKTKLYVEPERQSLQGIKHLPGKLLTNQNNYDNTTMLPEF
jgi:hypothetical protein